MLSAAIGLALREARKSRGLSRAELATTSSVSLRLVAEFERGARPNISLETAVKLLAAVGLSLHAASHTGLASAESGRVARRAMRVETWTGSVSTLKASRPAIPLDTVAARLAAVTSVSRLGHAIAHAAEHTGTQETMTPATSVSRAYRDASSERRSSRSR